MSDKAPPARGPQRGGAAAERAARDTVRDSQPRPEAGDPSTTRRWPRIQLEAEARVQLDHLGSEGSAVDARIVNVSERGIYLATEDPRPIGTRIRLRIHVAAPPLRTTVAGIVIHVVGNGPPRGGRKPGVGVFLDEVDDAWVEFCRARSGDVAATQGSGSAHEPGRPASGKRRGR